MRVRLRRTLGLVVLPIRLRGARRQAAAILALDTGASHSMLKSRLVSELGGESVQSPVPLQIVTASSVEAVRLAVVKETMLLGRVVSNHSYIVHDLPVASGIDGVIGLDLLEGRRLTIDFLENWLELQ